MQVYKKPYKHPEREQVTSAHHRAQLLRLEQTVALMRIDHEHLGRSYREVSDAWSLERRRGDRATAIVVFMTAIVVFMTVVALVLVLT